MANGRVGSTSGLRRARAYALFAVVAIIVAIAYSVLSSRAVSRPLPWAALVNATYPVSVRPDPVTLRDGLFEVEAAPGSAARIVVRAAGIGAFGDIDGVAEPDAAVILVSSGGGSGTFVELSAVLNAAGKARPVATTLLGDRVLVREVRVVDRTIIVRLRDRGATDPLSLRTRELTRTFRLDGDRLVQIATAESDVPTPPADAFVYRTDRLDVPAGGQRDANGTLAPGHIASYVVHAKAGQIVDLRVRSEFDNAVLSVFGLADGVQLVSRREYATERSLRITAEQDYAVKVVSLAGQDLPFAMQVGLRAPAVAPTAAPSQTNVPRPTHTPSPATPDPRPDRALADISPNASAFARTRPPVWGVAAYVPSAGLTYAENPDEEVPTASVVKLLVLLTVLEQARADHRPVAEAELALLWPMITESDNDATSELWERIGRGQAVAAYMRSIGVGGFTPDPGTSWGVSFVSARALATTLGKLVAGQILDETTRALALRLLDGVVPEQRWGAAAGTSTADGDRVGIKDGWYPGDEGWRVNSAAVIRPRAGNAYAIAVVTDGSPTWREGIETIEGIATQVNRAMRGR